VADSYAAVNYPTSNFATSATLRVGRSYYSDPQSTYASFLGFDISSIPKNKVMKSAILSVYIASFTSQAGSSLASDYYSYPEALANSPIVIKSRRVHDIPLGIVESELNYNYVKELPGNGNVYDVLSSGDDASINISQYRGSRVNIPIYDTSRINDEFVVALLRDENFINDISQGFNANIHSSEGYSTPQLTLVIDDYVPPKPVNLSPSNTVRNKAGDIKLSWQWEDTSMGATQASYEISYSVDGFVTPLPGSGTTNAYHIIPANNFTDGQIVQWKVRITDSNGDVSGWSDIVSFTIGATVPSAPEALSPINTIVNSSDEIYFRWNYIDLYGNLQAKFDLQYRKGSGIETTITLITTAYQYIMPSNTIIDGGDYSWRVRCYNAFGEVGAYSAWKPFYAIGKPPAPIITSVSNNMKPLVKWTANGQDVFVLKIYKDNVSIYDSGEQVSNSEFAVPVYLEDGAYKVGITINNIYGFWSDETVLLFSINTAKPTAPSISVNVNGLITALIINSVTAKNLIYRKGEKEDSFKLLGEANGNTFIDYIAPSGSNQYYARSITDTSFKDSSIIAANMVFNGIVLSGKNNQSDMINLYRTKDADKRKSIAPSKTQFMVQFNGRIYPTSQDMPFRNHAENHEYFIRYEDYDTFYRISHYNVLVYRNNYGYSFEASMSNRGLQENEFGYVVNFTLTRLEE
jgi:hypothetical protein